MIKDERKLGIKSIHKRKYTKTNKQNGAEKKYKI